MNTNSPEYALTYFDIEELSNGKFNIDIMCDIVHVANSLHEALNFISGQTGLPRKRIRVKSHHNGVKMLHTLYTTYTDKNGRIQEL